MIVDYQRSKIPLFQIYWLAGDLSVAEFLLKSLFARIWLGINIFLRKLVNIADIRYLVAGFFTCAAIITFFLSIYVWVFIKTSKIDFVIFNSIFLYTSLSACFFLCSMNEHNKVINHERCSPLNTVISQISTFT